MKLCTFRIHTEERLGVIYKESIIDINVASALYMKRFRSINITSLQDPGLVPPDIISFLSAGNHYLELTNHVLASIEQLIESPANERIAFRRDEVKLLPPIPKPHNIFGVAINYYSHLKENPWFKNLPDNVLPLFFQKPATSITGPEDHVIIPKVSKKVDYETELGVVIGRRGKYIQRAEAYDYIAGYTVFNDISFRDWVRFPEYQSVPDYRPYTQINFAKSKGMDNSSLTGPYLVLRDEIPNPYPLRLTTRVNGEVRQQGSTDDMIVKIPELIEYLSSGMTLYPGDLIATGTCAGVAFWATKDLYLKDGDTLESEVERIGVLRNKVSQEK